MVKAEARDDGDEAKCAAVLKSPRCHWNFGRKNRELVGLGSYIVNAVGECNGCHSAGPQTEYLLGQSIPRTTGAGKSRDLSWRWARLRSLSLPDLDDAHCLAQSDSRSHGPRDWRRHV